MCDRITNAVNEDNENMELRVTSSLSLSLSVAKQMGLYNIMWSSSAATFYVKDLKSPGAMVVQYWYSK